MDVVDAIPVWIDNRCYRLLPIRDGTRIFTGDDDYGPVTGVEYGGDEEIDDPGIPITHTGDRYYATMHIPGPMIGHVKGTKNRMIKILERNGSTVSFAPTKYKRIPSEDSTEAIITASNKAAVASTCIQIKNIIINQRLREDFTHFISLPINLPHIQKAFLTFKEEILKKYRKARGISESIFQDPNKLHVTVTMLVLLDERDRELAEAVLNKCIDNIKRDYGNKQFTVNVRGVEYMNDDPAEVDVLYAKLHEENEDTSLQVIANMIMTEFVQEHLAKNQYEEVKLHITLMNTKFRDFEEVAGEEERRITFDARNILEDYKEYDFGKITISEIHISVRHTTGLDGFYISRKKIKL